MKTVNIGPLVIEIKNNDNMEKLIIKELNCIDSERSIDLILEVNNTKKLAEYTPEIFSAKGDMNFNKNNFFVNYLDEISYIVKNLFNNKVTEIQINTNKKSAKKLLKSIYHNGKQQIEKNTILSYSLFWYIIHIELLNKKSSFIHAGIIDINNQATIITGTGGCGKTSTLFKILEDSKTNYIAEDFAIIHENGYTYYNPKAVSIYATDMEFGQNILKNHFNTFSKQEKFIWSLKRNILKRNPMIKVLPDKLMKNRIARDSKIKNVLYFIRNNSDNISIEDINTNNLIERILDASMRELKTLNELLLLMRSNAPRSYKIPSFDDVREKTRYIYMNAFKNTNNKIIYIPHKTNPNDLVLFLKEQELI